jgi:thioesterase domain-containing protein
LIDYPLSALHGGDGGVFSCGNLADRLDKNRPFYTFAVPALTTDVPLPDQNVAETAAKYLAEMHSVKPYSLYLLCGHSFGGVAAYEMACQMIAAGEEVKFPGLGDTDNHAYEARNLRPTERVAMNWNKRNGSNAEALEKSGDSGKRISSSVAYRLFFGGEDAKARHFPNPKNPSWLRQLQLHKVRERAVVGCIHREFAGKPTLFRARVGDDCARSLRVEEIEFIGLPRNHVSIFDKNNIEGVSEAFRQSLAKAGSGVII